MKKTDAVEIVLAVTANYIPMAAVMARSIIEKTNGNLRFHILYAYNKDERLARNIEMTREMISKFPNAQIEFYDVEDKMEMFRGLPLGKWAEWSKTFYSHYIYWTAPLVLPNDIDKVIYIDADMVCNADIMDVWKTNMTGKLLAAAAPNGIEPESADEFNSGFLIMNLNEWRKNNTLKHLIEHGIETAWLPHFGSDQRVMNLYFRLQHPDKITYIDTEWNCYYPKEETNRAFICHFIVGMEPKPWFKRVAHPMHELWWKTAGQTPFYPDFVSDLKKYRKNPQKYNVSKSLTPPDRNAIDRREGFDIKIWPLFSRRFKREEQKHWSIRYSILGGILRFVKNDHNSWKISVCGIRLYSHDRERDKFLFMTVRRFDARDRWIGKLQARIDPQYDDIYIFRHNIGETYVELMHLADRIKANKSKRPMLVLWRKNYLGFYNMFLPKGADMRYIELDQDEIHGIFDPDEMIARGHQRFFCSTPKVSESIKELAKTKPDANFYNYIKARSGVKPDAKHMPPKPSAGATKCVDEKIRRMGLGKKFLIIAPGATTLSGMNSDFWNIIIDAAREKGYDIFMNTYLNDAAAKITKSADMNIEEMLALAKKSSGMITLGSGLAVFLTAAGVPMDLIYTDFRNKQTGYDSADTIRYYSVLHLPDVSPDLVKEYDSAKMTDRELLDAILKRY